MGYVSNHNAPSLRFADKALAWLPHAIVAAETWLLVRLLSGFDWISFAAFVLIPYAIPLILYRAVTWKYPLKEGTFFYEPGKAAVWILSFRLQAIYGAFPFLERLLIVLGLYSAWLRLWGSRIGRNILWTSHTQILDRAGMEVGDNCFIGHQCIFTSHVTDVRRNRILIHYSKIRIGNDVFIGAGSNVGPGARIADGTRIPALTTILINRRVSNDSFDGGATRGPIGADLPEATATETGTWANSSSPPDS